MRRPLRRHAEPTGKKDVDPVARLNRDHTRNFEHAALWFSRALRDSAPAPPIAYLIVRELVECYIVKLETPSRAAPLLARVAEERQGTREGAWAAGELVRIKADMAERREG